MIKSQDEKGQGERMKRKNSVKYSLLAMATVPILLLGFLVICISVKRFEMSLHAEVESELLKRKNGLNDNSLSESEPKYDIRKWFSSEKGETIGKGVGLSKEGMDELTNILLKNGFGTTEGILESIKDRDDFNSALSVLSDEQLESAGIDPSTIEKEEYYDPTKDFFDDEEVI